MKKQIVTIDEIISSTRRPRSPKKPSPRDQTGAQHGTHNKYANYGCRCPECRKAHTAYMRELRATEERLCDVSGCGGKRHSNGLCFKHYKERGDVSV